MSRILAWSRSLRALIVPDFFAFMLMALNTFLNKGVRIEAIIVKSVVDADRHVRLPIHSRSRWRR